MKPAAWMKPRVTLWGWLLVVSLIGGESLYAQPDTDEQILDSSIFPWYDAQTEKVKPLPFEPRPEIRSGDRNQIPPAVPSTTNNNAGGGNAAGTGGDLSFIFWVFLAVVLVAILGLMVWAFLKLESSDQKNAKQASRRSLAESIEQLPFQIDSATGDFRALAQRAYHAGDYRRATIFLYSHLLVALDQSGLIRLRKGKTNRQYARELAPQLGLKVLFQQTMEAFEAVFFGDHEISREAFEDCWRQLPGFQAELDRSQTISPEVAFEN